MAVLVRAGYELPGLAAVYVALGLVLLAAGVVSAIDEHVPNPAIGIPHIGTWRPLNFVHDVLQAATEALQDAEDGLEAQAAKFQQGLRESLFLLVGIPLLLAVATKEALSYLWNHALEPRIEAAVRAVRGTASQALVKASGVEAASAAAVATAEAYARARASAAVDTAEDYADHVATVAKRAAESYADEAVGKLRAAESSAIAAAHSLAARAEDAAVNAGQLARAAESTAESAAAKAVRAAEAAAAGATVAAVHALELEADEALRIARDAAARAEAAAAGVAGAVTHEALDAVRSIAITAEDGLEELREKLGDAGLVGIIAAVPLLATLVTSIATEAGLERAECRSKVKQICGTDPSAWASLLEGAALVGLGFGLSTLVEVGREIIEETEEIVAALG